MIPSSQFNNSLKFFLMAVLFIIISAFPLFPQDQNLNLYYHSPITMSAEYYSWSPFGIYSKEFNVFEAGTTLRFPLPGLPTIQPLFRATYHNFESMDEELPEKWDHLYTTIGGGIGFNSRFSKNFELGIEAAGAWGYSYYDSLVAKPVGYSVIVAGAGLRLSLIPSFNVSIDVMPQVRYLYAFNDVDKFNGFSIAIGFGAAYRFGQDPDLPRKELHSIRFTANDVPPLFAALQSYYVTNPIGTISIENSDEKPIEDVDVLFFQAGFMDSPTPAHRIPKIEPGESVIVNLPASFNAEVFDLEGITPLTGEIIVQYTQNGRVAEQRQSVTYDLHDKNALTWTDDRKMGSFITPADSAVRNYMSYIRQQAREAVLDGISESFQVASLAYNALAELGIIYQIDPTSPFTEVQGNNTIVDSVSLPRETLKRLAGDCDDLTALFTTMLETVGIETAFVTTPGHIYMAFNSGLAAAKYYQISPDRALLLIIDDNIWIPVEVTMLGQGSFIDSWRTGADEWNRAPASGRGFFKTRDAQGVFRPVGLRQADLGLQYGDMDNILKGFNQDLSITSDAVLSDVRKAAENGGNKREYNRLGILAAQWGRYNLAADAFNKASVLDPNYISARMNLGSVAFLRKNFEEAKTAFEAARDAGERSVRISSGTKATILLNLSKTYYELGELSASRETFESAEVLDSAAVKEFSYLANISSDGSARASDAASGPVILFAEGDE
jgi:tetratricopeptide (TPR) repeat protein